MKGAALTICPDATLVDLTHDIPAQDCLAGALELEAAYRYLPPGTVFLVVVDPGVGSSPRPIAVETAGYRFVGPDNGVLEPAFKESGWRAVELTDARYWRPEISRTFEGRDRFAPVAAWLARGTSLADLGPEIANPARLALIRESTTTTAGTRRRRMPIKSSMLTCAPLTIARTYRLMN
jgi:hypothetical protein